MDGSGLGLMSLLPYARDGAWMGMAAMTSRAPPGQEGEEGRPCGRGWRCPDPDGPGREREGEQSAAEKCKATAALPPPPLTRFAAEPRPPVRLRIRRAALQLEDVEVVENRNSRRLSCSGVQAALPACSLGLGLVGGRSSIQRTRWKRAPRAWVGQGTAERAGRAGGRAGGRGDQATRRREEGEGGVVNNKTVPPGPGNN